MQFSQTTGFSFFSQNLNTGVEKL